MCYLFLSLHTEDYILSKDNEMVLSVCEQSRNMNLDFNTLSTAKNIIGDLKKVLSDSHKIIA